MIALSLTYSDSYSPITFFADNENQFSYAGSPDHAFLFINSSTEFYYTPGGDTILVLSGKTTTWLYPYGNVTLKYRNNSIATILNGPVKLTSTESDEYKIGTYFYGNYTSLSNSAYIHLSKAMFHLNRRKNSYIFSFPCTNGSLYEYRVLSKVSPIDTNTTKIHHQISTKKGMLHINDNLFKFDGYIEYDGSLDVFPSGDTYAVIPIHDITFSAFRIDRADLLNADGGLILSGRTLTLSVADNIFINSSKTVMLPYAYALTQNGKLYISGTADSLILRKEQYIARPINLFINKDLNLTFVTSSLTSILTLMLSRAVARFKKK